ncbi:hypothetical protein Tco_0708036 [Tanacetum coccineum]
MHVVPLPMTGNYMPYAARSRALSVALVLLKFTYGPKQSQTSESETQTSDFDTCESDCSVETHESLPEPTVNEPKVVSQPKVWSDAPIIEEYESDSEDEHVSLPTKEQETPSFANQQVKTPRETVKNQFTHSKNPKVDKKGLGYGFTTKACFVCGSLSHLIRDCDFHEKRMAKQAELNNRMRKKSSQREIRPIWNNVQRMNHRNQFVPKAVLTRTGKILVNTARASGTNTVNTARHNVNRHAVPTNVANIVNTVKPIVNNARPKKVYSKRRIIVVTKLEIVDWHNYKHLDWITVRMDDDKLYKFKEGDFNRLHIQDIEDMLLLLVQGKLTNLAVEERLAFNVSLRMFTRSVFIQRRVEDLQLGVESYQKKLNLTKPDTYRPDLKRREAYTTYSNPRGFIYQNKDKKNRLMRIDELHKFSDGTLNDVRTALNDRLKGIRMEYLPQTIWRQSDKNKAGAMI